MSDQNQPKKPELPTTPAEMYAAERRFYPRAPWAHSFPRGLGCGT